jgi:hypothetical protein
VLKGIQEDSEYWRGTVTGRPTVAEASTDNDKNDVFLKKITMITYSFMQ